MVVSLLPLAVVILAAWIQRPHRSRKEQWATSYRAALGATAAFCLVTIGSACARGLSVTSLALVGIAMLVAGLLLNVLVEPKIALGIRLAVLTMQRVRYFTPRTWILTGWSAMLILALVAPLSYAGAFSGDVGASEFASRVVPKQLDPVTRVAPIAEGQCMQRRDPEEVNRVHSCLERHKAEVIAAVDKSDDCPGVPESAADGYRMRIESTSSIDGSRFCILVSVDPGMSWSGRFGSLPETR